MWGKAQTDGNGVADLVRITGFRVTCILGISGFGGISQLRAFRLNPMGFEGFGIWSHGICWDLTKGFWDLKLHAFRGISWDLGCGISGFENCYLGISGKS